LAESESAVLPLDDFPAESNVRAAGGRACMVFPTGFEPVFSH